MLHWDRKVTIFHDFRYCNAFKPALTVTLTIQDHDIWSKSEHQATVIKKVIILVLQ